LQPCIGHVVAITYPGYSFAGNSAAVFDVGKYVGQYLAGVKFVGQAVNYRHARMRRKGLDLGLFIGANHYQVHHAANDFGTVFNRFGAPQLAVAGGQVHHAAAHLVHAGLKAHPGAGGGLFENHGQRAVYQRAVFFIRLELVLDGGGALQHIQGFIGAQVVKLKVVLHGRYQALALKKF